jgi:hypothetical protein
MCKMVCLDYILVWSFYSLESLDTCARCVVFLHAKEGFPNLPIVVHPELIANRYMLMAKCFTIFNLKIFPLLHNPLVDSNICTIIVS